jgi:predicted unusual protein kinase regulating ubiquinone biosynthesis (AarF/ABC1/UbiB family)
MKIHGDPPPVRKFKRFDEILDTLFKRRIYDQKDEKDHRLLTPSSYHSPQRIRRTLEELGLSFIKLGQLMSTGADIFPAEYIEAFKKLQGRVPPVPFEDIKSVIEKELKSPLRDLLLLFKTLIQTEALGKILGSDASLLETTRPYAKKLRKVRYDTQKIIHDIRKETESMGGYMKMIPKYVHDILKQAAGGKQRVELWHNGFQQIDTKFEK